TGGAGPPVRRARGTPPRRRRLGVRRQHAIAGDRRGPGRARLRMTPQARLLLLALGAVVLLIVSIARFKLHPFVALTTISLALGVAAGMDLGAAVKAFQDGVGGVLGFIAVVVGL